MFGRVAEALAFIARSYILISTHIKIQALNFVFIDQKTHREKSGKTHVKAIIISHF